MDATPAGFSERLKAFALAHEADDLVIAPMHPPYVFEGYAVEEPWVVVLGAAHDYERLQQVPSSATSAINRAGNTVFPYAGELDPQLRLQRHPLPRADGGCAAGDPASDCAGLGELGKHGSLISPRCGSGDRPAAMTTCRALPAEPGWKARA